MAEKLVQLEDKKTDINEGWFEDILHEFPCLKFALGYAKINSSRLSVSDWLIHARVKLDVDLARGYFPIRHSLSDMECTGAIEFLLTALLYGLLPLLNAMTSQYQLISNLQRQAYVLAGFDLMMLALAALFYMAAKRLRSPKKVLATRPTKATAELGVES